MTQLSLERTFLTENCSGFERCHGSSIKQDTFFISVFFLALQFGTISVVSNERLLKAICEMKVLFNLA